MRHRNPQPVETLSQSKTPANPAESSRILCSVMALLDQTAAPCFRARAPPAVRDVKGRAGLALGAARPRDGLGAVGRAELAQDVADMLLDGVEGDYELPGDGLFDRPAASISSTSSSRLVSGSTMPGTAAVPRPGSGMACPASNARWSLARQPSETPRRRQHPCHGGPLGCCPARTRHVSGWDEYLSHLPEGDCSRRAVRAYGFDLLAFAAGSGKGCRAGEGNHRFAAAVPSCLPSGRESPGLTASPLLQPALAVR